MYNNKDSRESLLNAGLTAALGAGVVTSYAVSQGQHPLVALAITAISATFAIACYKTRLF